MTSDQWAMTSHAILVAAALGYACGAVAQAYPVKPVRLVIPVSAGGGSDVVGRFLASKLTEALGQQVIVENRAGAGGTIGVESVIRTVPDGYTLLLAPGSSGLAGFQ